jgi:hypothetical protein
VGGTVRACAWSTGFGAKNTANTAGIEAASRLLVNGISNEGELHFFASAAESEDTLTWEPAFTVTSMDAGACDISGDVRFHGEGLAHFGV